MSFEKLDQLIDSLPARGFPANEVAITHHGRLVYRRASGFSDVDATRPVSGDDLYWIFSISKITTCITALRLVEEGRLRMEDPVSKYLPAYANLSVKQPDGSIKPAQTVMTVEHLFLMTGGLDYNIRRPAILAAMENPNCTTWEWVNSFVAEPLRFEPGSHYLYSLCHDVLAAVVEVVTGERFADYAKRVVFDPLGMKDTAYHPDEQMLQRLSALYQYEHGIYRAKPVDRHNPWSQTAQIDSGGGGLCSSVTDQIRLMTVLACGGTTEDGYVLLKPETVASLQQNRLSDEARQSFNPTRLYGYGWGWCGRVHDNAFISGSRSSVGEFGWDGAAGAFAMIDPKREIALFYATHVQNSHYVYRFVHTALRDLACETLPDKS